MFAGVMTTTPLFVLLIAVQPNIVLIPDPICYDSNTIRLSFWIVNCCSGKEFLSWITYCVPFTNAKKYLFCKLSNSDDWPTYFKTSKLLNNTIAIHNYPITWWSGIPRAVDTEEGGRQWRREPPTIFWSKNFFSP